MDKVEIEIRRWQRKKQYDVIERSKELLKRNSSCIQCSEAIGFGVRNGVYCVLLGDGDLVNMCQDCASRIEKPKKGILLISWLLARDERVWSIPTPDCYNGFPRYDENY